MPAKVIALVNTLEVDNIRDTRPVSDDLLLRMDAWWRAANYLTVAQIYLRDNPLLREPLRPEHIKPRLLGHWGTSPGLSLIYVHLNRLIRERDANVVYLAGPGHGGPAILANVYLEGTYSETYPAIAQDEAGVRRLCRQFSTPGGVPSHVSAPTPGSIHEGGELGYVLVHAFGAAFDNPDLIVAAVVGDGEAETGPLAGSWSGINFLHPVRDGAVLPILHLNGYKIGGPTVLGRQGPERARQLLEAHGYHVHVVGGDDPLHVHRRLADVMDLCHAEIREIQSDARARGVTACPRWPAIVLRTPKGWTGPHTVDGLLIEGTFARAPGPALGGPRGPRAPAHARGVAAQLPARGAVRRARAARPRAGRAGAGRRSAHGRQPARERRRCWCRWCCRRSPTTRSASCARRPSGSSRRAGWA
jgi:xylulose-5-phosphate/fructose-6-phosphate phosphoketolase